MRCISDLNTAPVTPPNRRARSETALRQINNLRIRRTQSGEPTPGGIPGGQMARRTPQAYNAGNSRASAAGPDAGETRAANPRMAKFAARPTTTHGSAPPEGGRMVRAPGALKITRESNATVGSVRRSGPNLRGRSGGKGGAGKPGGREQGPKKRERNKEGGGERQSTKLADIDTGTTLSDGMVHHLLRLQRKEWDRVPYQPKYAPGSFAAQELIHEGRELFRGESPPVKYWGRLEKRIGLVGMFGAEAHLKVRRVPDGDEAPFGQEPEEALEVEAPAEGQKQEAAAH